MTAAVLAWPVGFVLLAARAGSVADARLTVETSGPTRVYLTDGAGAPVTPPAVPAYHKGEEHHFIVPGRLEIELPPGRYRLTAERGPEHRPVSMDLELRAGDRRRVELRPERWTDMNARGWYSADLHRNLAPTLADWVWEDSQRGQAPVTSDPIRSVDARHAYSVLDKEVERLMEGPGAVEAQSLRPLERLEVLYRGGVIHTLRPPDAPDTSGAPGRLAAEFDFTPDRDGWIAARAFERPGRTIRFSHTSPVYLERGVPASAADDARFFLDWIDREVRLYQASAGFRREADRAAMLDFFAKGRAVYERLAR